MFQDTCDDTMVVTPIMISWITWYYFSCRAVVEQCGTYDKSLRLWAVISLEAAYPLCCNCLPALVFFFQLQAFPAIGGFCHVIAHLCVTAIKMRAESKDQRRCEDNLIDPFTYWSLDTNTRRQGLELFRVHGKFCNTDVLRNLQWAP